MPEDLGAQRICDEAVKEKTGRRRKRPFVKIRFDPNIDLGQTHVKTGLFPPRDATRDNP